MFYDVVRIFFFEGKSGESEYLARREGIAQHIVDKEIVEFVWTDEIFRLLFD